MAMKIKLAVVFLCAIIFFAPIACADNPRVVIRTMFGDIGLELFYDEAPFTVQNFLDYMNSGFYDGLVIHRTGNNFMIQGGSHELLGSWPWLWKRTDGLMPPIPNESDNGLMNVRGTISMALLPGDPNSGTSGFFINQVHNWWLDELHTVFGEVLNGMEIVDFIAQLPHIDPNLVAGQQEVPVYIDALGNMYLVHVPKTFAAPPGYWIKADINYDGTVDEWDLGALCSNWLNDAELGDMEVVGDVDFGEFGEVAKSWRRTSVWRRFTESDVDNSNEVNLRDFALLARDWRKNGIELQGDLNLDGTVDEIDLMYLSQDWLKEEN